MDRIACTIVSTNYLHFAWTLAESFLRLHPSDIFFVLIVDHLPADFASRDSRVQIVEVEELCLQDFRSLAFKYDLLELNTAVKPSFIKYLFTLGANKVIYFDPDIYLFQSAELIYGALDTSSIVLTPHLLAPTGDQEHVYEKGCLGVGVFNLGFVAVSNSEEGQRFISWWEERCLAFGYHDLRSGLFVDQKWIDLVPCFFSKVHVLRHPGCNVAYWNLPERLLAVHNDHYVLNGTWPLIFFHYSGYNPRFPERLSSKLRLPQESNGALESLLDLYGNHLRKNGADAYESVPYTYGSFANGMLVPLLARRLYSATLKSWQNVDPFDHKEELFKTLKKMGLISKLDRSGRYSSNNLETADWRIRFINRSFLGLAKLLGGDRYTMLMKYLSYVTILRNQREVFFPADSDRLRKEKM